MVTTSPAAVVVSVGTSVETLRRQAGVPIFGPLSERRGGAAPGFHRGELRQAVFTWKRQVACSGWAASCSAVDDEPYRALEAPEHRREHLIQMLWDVPDDPRAALRWSLPKLRKVSAPTGRPTGPATAAGGCGGPTGST